MFQYIKKKSLATQYRNNVSDIHFFFKHQN